MTERERRLTIESTLEEFHSKFPKISGLEIEQNKQRFASFDKDGDGLLNKAELKNLLENVGFRSTSAEVDAIYGDIGDKTNGITLETFIKHHFEKDIQKKIAQKKSRRFVPKMMENASVASIFEYTTSKHPNKPAIFFEGRTLTWGQINDSATQVAHWGRSIGLKKGDIVALNMDNRPEFLISWLGFSKIGVSSAFINNNLKDKSLYHCVTISDAKHLIFGIEVADKVLGVQQQLRKEGITLHCWDQDVKFARGISNQILHFPIEPISIESKPSDFWALIYTSGTTGLPKAALIPNTKFWGAASFFASQFEITDQDIIYNCLPLYHSSGGMICVGMSFFTGATLVLRRKFSATAFWQEIRDYDCTVFQYIGELCRYLSMSPPNPLDSQNKLRIAVGNGLRPDIWESFQKRFGIPEIGEFYAATEGNASLWLIVSGEEGRGAIGHRGYLLRREPTHLRIVKFDVENEVPIRGPDGFCILCQPGETGELLGEIIDSNPGKQFIGYHKNQEGNNKKILRDVFKKGDKYFRTGDLIKETNDGYYYFVDRIGDTFRWKGENVSTNEVAEIISTFPGVQEVNVYGVQIPGSDGRAGMCALVPEGNVDFVKLGQFVSSKLPSYSIPLFLRVLPKISITGTFKHQKVELRNDGMNPEKVKDPLYFFDPSQKIYKKFTLSDYQSIIQGRSRL